MKLVLVSLEDMLLYEKMFMDEEYMAHLGGAQTQEQTVSIIERHIRYSEIGKGKVLKFIPDEEDFGDKLDLVKQNIAEKGWFDYRLGVGSLCVFEGFHSFHKDVPLTQVGWGMLTQYNGFGLATKALKLLFESLKGEESRWGNLHAFTGIANGPSNRLCQRLGFELVEETLMNGFGPDQIVANHYMYRLLE